MSPEGVSGIVAGVVLCSDQLEGYGCVCWAGQAGCRCGEMQGEDGALADPVIGDVAAHFPGEEA